MNMESLQELVKKRVVERLVPRLDNRRGAVLFLGGHLPEIALHVLKRGMFVTVVETRPEQMERFLAPLKQEGVDKAVTWERRPYSMVEFLMSSYTYAIVWEGIPDGLAPVPFLKKLRREVKVGATLYLRVPALPSVPALPEALAKASAGLPASVRTRLGQAGEALSNRMALPGALPVATVKQAAENILNLEAEIPLSVVAERLALLPAPAGRALAGLPAAVLAAVETLDRKLAASPGGALLASSVLLEFARSREFGNVFRVQ
jgi:hypothetical protein